MTPGELRAIMVYLREKVQLGPKEDGDPVTITFQTPLEEEMIAARLNAAGVQRLLHVPWWKEMVEDIVETPDMCDPDDSPEQILEYARDVVSEYISKRFPIEGE